MKALDVCRSVSLVCGFICTHDSLAQEAGGVEPRDSRHSSPAKVMAESDPDQFMDLLESRVLEDLLKERYRETHPSLDKYEAFVATIENHRSRHPAQELLRDLRANYRTTWHQRYPVPLAERWHEIKGNPVAKRDFAEILRMSGVGSSSYEEISELLQPVQGLTLFGPIHYLDPLKTAVEKLNSHWEGNYTLRSQKITSRNRLESAGFPLDTFAYYSFDVQSPPNSINRVFFVVDQYKRVVAFQKVIESPGIVRLSNHNNNRSVYNFVQMRRKGTPSYRIGYRSSGSSVSSVRWSRTTTSRVCVLESELIDRSRKPREWVKLYIPLQLARVCLYCCEQIDD